MIVPFLSLSNISIRIRYEASIWLNTLDLGFNEIRFVQCNSLKSDWISNNTFQKQVFFIYLCHSTNKKLELIPNVGTVTYLSNISTGIRDETSIGVDSLEKGSLLICICNTLRVFMSYLSIYRHLYKIVRWNSTDLFTFLRYIKQIQQTWRFLGMFVNHSKVQCWAWFRI